MRFYESALEIVKHCEALNVQDHLSGTPTTFERVFYGQGVGHLATSTKKILFVPDRSVRLPAVFRGPQKQNRTERTILDTSDLDDDGEFCGQHLVDATLGD